MQADVLRRTLADQWRALAAWTVGLVLLSLTYAAFYPVIRHSGINFQNLFNQLPAGFRDAFLGAGVSYATPVGYLGTELFAFLVPALLLAVGVTATSRALAGEESGGTIDLLLATPLPRGRLVVEKALAGVLPLFGLAAAVWLVIAVLGPAFGLTVDLGGLAVALLAVVLLATCFAMLALLVSSASGQRGLGAGIAAAAAVATYVLNALAPSVSSLQGVDAAASPFHWSGGPSVLADGVSWTGLGLLMAVPLVLLALTVGAYERRDLSA